MQGKLHELKCASKAVDGRGHRRGVPMWIYIVLGEEWRLAATSTIIAQASATMPLLVRSASAHVIALWQGEGANL